MISENTALSLSTDLRQDSFHDRPGLHNTYDAQVIQAKDKIGTVSRLFILERNSSKISVAFPGCDLVNWANNLLRVAGYTFTFDLCSVGAWPRWLTVLYLFQFMSSFLQINTGRCFWVCGHMAPFVGIFKTKLTVKIFLCLLLKIQESASWYFYNVLSGINMSIVRKKWTEVYSSGRKVSPEWKDVCLPLAPPGQ